MEARPWLARAGISRGDTEPFPTRTPGARTAAPVETPEPRRRRLGERGRRRSARSPWQYPAIQSRAARSTARQHRPRPLRVSILTRAEPWWVLGPTQARRPESEGHSIRTRALRIRRPARRTRARPAPDVAR